MNFSSDCCYRRHNCFIYSFIPIFGLLSIEHYLFHVWWVVGYRVFGSLPLSTTSLRCWKSPFFCDSTGRRRRVTAVCSGLDLAIVKLSHMKWASVYIASPLGPDARPVCRRWVGDALSLAKTKRSCACCFYHFAFIISKDWLQTLPLRPKRSERSRPSCAAESEPRLNGLLFTLFARALSFEVFRLAITLSDLGQFNGFQALFQIFFFFSALKGKGKAAIWFNNSKDIRKKGA